ncbi:hypothetical protein LCGC14_2213130, partial [marine sediment metagenome]
WFFLFIFAISFCSVFIIAPQWQVIPVLCIIGSIIFFTIETKTIRRNYQNKRRINSRNNGYISQKQDVQDEPRHARGAYLVLIFLVFFPLIFAVNSMLSISSPEMTYTRIPNSNRIDGSVDLTNLEFYSSLEDIEGLTINDEFIIKSIISPSPSPSPPWPSPQPWIP